MQQKILRDAFAGMNVFVAVARNQSFTKAAARLGLSQTAVSHAIRTLEERLGVRLLSRNTRAVVATEAGERLLQNVVPLLSEIDTELDALTELGNSPTGRIRITASDHAIRTILTPKLKKFLPRYPGIQVELFSDNGFTDLAAGNFDAGVRMGESLAQDMIAQRIGADSSFAVVATKRYLQGRQLPVHPEDLMQHNCINIRLPTHGGLWAWEFEKEGNEVSVRVEGQLIHNGTFECLDAAIAGLGIAYVPEEMAMPYIKSGHLIRMLEDWSPIWPGLHLYYPSRRQPSGAMALLVAELRLEP